MDYDDHTINSSPTIGSGRGASTTRPPFPAEPSLGSTPTKGELATPQGGRLRPGDVLLGRYTVLAELGEGGMGVVYKCLDSIGGIEVAIKCLPPELSRNESEMEGIRENYAIVARLHHSAISGLRQLEKDSESGEYYLVMDLAKGEDLSAILRRRHRVPMPLEEALAILRPLASALDYAHGEHVLHRDVKPANVKVDGNHVQLLDFGLAAEVRSSMSRVSLRGHAGSSGTPAYMAPEQWEARHQGAATDQYSLAVMAYQMLSGYPPFDAVDQELLRRAVLTRAPEEIDGVPAHVNAALQKALAKNLGSRFPSCTAFIEALFGQKLVGRRLQHRAILCLAMTTIIALGVILSTLYRQDKNEARIPLDLLETSIDAIMGDLEEFKDVEVATHAAAVIEEAVMIRDEAVVLRNHGEFAKAEAKFKEAKASCQLALSISQRARTIVKEDNPQAVAEAVAWFRKFAQLGNAWAQNNVGWMYGGGYGVAKDDAEAIKWYRKAADQGNAWGQSNLGVMYENGRGVPQDYAEAVEWYRKAAAQGNAWGQNNLGVMYENGRGVPQDYAEAVKWYRKAAEQGNAAAQYNLGVMYDYGRGVPQDDAEAVKWYRKAARWSLKAAELGYHLDQNRLGVMYDYGRGVPQDDAEAVKWYRKAADQGNAWGQNNLGLMYCYGRGVPQDDAEAVKWYRKAVDQGLANAQCGLGWMYEKGRGVPQDDAEAVKWYHKAAEQGFAQGQINIGLMYENGRGVPQDYAEAVKWYRKAADQGNAWGQNNLGVMYENGHGVPQDDAEAVKWYRKAAEQGNENAKKALKGRGIL